jgi:hypothetical protein
MNIQREARLAGAAGLDKTSFLAGLDNRDIPPKLLPAQALISRNPRTVALPAGFIAAYGGDNFAPALHLIAEPPR